MVMRRAGNSQVKRSDTFWSRMRAPAICQFFETSGLIKISHDGNDDDKDTQRQLFTSISKHQVIIVNE